MLKKFTQFNMVHIFTPQNRYNYIQKFKVNEKWPPLYLDRFLELSSFYPAKCSGELSGFVKKKGVLQ